MFIYLGSGCAEHSLPCGLFSSGSEWGYSAVVVCGPLSVVASLVAEHGLKVLRL